MTCNYRNCDIEITRTNQKYCCRNHKTYEKTYIKREERFKQIAKDFNQKIIDDYNILKEMIK
jgi:hypothetical protein